MRVVKSILDRRFEVCCRGRRPVYSCRVWDVDLVKGFSELVLALCVIDTAEPLCLLV